MMTMRTTISSLVTLKNNVWQTMYIQKAYKIYGSLGEKKYED